MTKIEDLCQEAKAKGLLKLPHHVFLRGFLHWLRFGYFNDLYNRSKRNVSRSLQSISKKTWLTYSLRHPCGCKLCKRAGILHNTHPMSKIHTACAETTEPRFSRPWRRRIKHRWRIVYPNDEHFHQFPDIYSVRVITYKPVPPNPGS